jgi:hypothetical protein
VDNVGNVWQIVDGSAGTESGDDGLTFLDIVVGSSEAIINVYRDGQNGTFSLADTIAVQAN